VQKDDISPSQGGPGFGFLPERKGFLVPYQSVGASPVQQMARSVGSAARSAGSAATSAARDTKRALSDFGYSIRDRTSSSGFASGMQSMFDSMRQAAANAGLARLEVVAGKGQGHLSHAHGTEADIIGYNADGSKWTKAQRVAVAQGAATAGGNRFGFYSGPTLHVGLGYAGAPKNVVWNNKLRGVPGVDTFAPEERDFVNALRTGKLASYAPTGASSRVDPQVAALQQDLNTIGAGLQVDGIMGPRTRAAMSKYNVVSLPPASAYTPSNTQATRGLQAASGLAGGSTSYERGSQVAALQRDLNSRGANLTVDGIRGPLTMAAEKQFLGSPTSVRTGGFTAGRAPTPSYTSGMQDEGRGLPRQNAPPAARPSYVTSGTQDEGRGVYSNPYTSSTGGANALTPVKVPTTAIKANPYGGTQLPSYSSNITYPKAVQPGARAVPTTAVPYGPRTAPVGATGTFNPPAQTQLQWSALQSPYANSTGGANAIQAPRIPQARPAYPLPAVVTAPAPTLMQSLQDHMRRAAAVAAQVGGQVRDAYRESTRSGMGYSGGAGGGYRGGSYGSAAGRSINEGVGGAFRNR
jgi:hypothetical protein